MRNEVKDNPTTTEQPISIYSIQDDYIGPFDSFSITDNIIDHLLKRVFNSSYSRAIDTKIPSYSAFTSMNTLKQETDLYLLSHDEGENDEEKPEHSWQNSMEPARQIDDICSRGIIAVNRHFTLPQNTELDAPLDVSRRSSTKSKKLKNYTLKNTGSVRQLLNEEKRVSYYKIPLAEKIIDPVIEELRRLRQIEEIKKMEELKKEQRNQKMMWDRRNQNNKEDIKFSYTPTGNLVEMEKKVELPKIAPKCRPNIVTKKDGMEEMQNVLPLESKTSVSIRENKNEQEKTIPKLNLNRAQKIMYDCFVPAAGVTYIEKGKTPKLNAVSFSESIGRISKLQLQSLAMENSMKANTFRLDESSRLLPPIDFHSVREIKKDLSETESIQFLDSSEGLSQDISQILAVADFKPNYFNLKTKSISSLPSKKTIKKFPVSAREMIGSNDLDSFNKSMNESISQIQSHRVLPIELPFRVNARQLRQSLGVLKKLPRNRGFNYPKRSYKSHALLPI